MGTLHHTSFGVSDIGRAAAFYDAALAPLGYVRVWEYLVPGDPDQSIGYGIAGGGDKLPSNCVRTAASARRGIPSGPGVAEPAGGP